MRERAVVSIFACAISVLVAVACQPALADCAGASVFFGNMEGQTFVRVDLSAPSAAWATYMLQDPTINQGAVPLSAVAVDLGPYGGEPGTAQVFGDWGGGLGLQGCPFSLDTSYTGILDFDDVNEVFVFSDSKNGATILILSSIGNTFDFDSASGTGGEIPRSVMRPEIVSARLASTTIYIEMRWAAPVINSDARSATRAASLLRGYRIFLRRLSTAGALLSENEIPDADGSTLDTHALVSFEKGPAGESSTLTVGADLAGGEGVGATARGVASALIYNPGLAIPKTPPGKGKGLLKAPGQQK